MKSFKKKKNNNRISIYMCIMFFVPNFVFKLNLFSGYIVINRLFISVNITFGAIDY